MHDFILLATFVRGILGRSKELRTMRLFFESEKKMAFDYTTVESENFIVFQEDERVIVLQRHQKQPVQLKLICQTT